MQLFYLAEKKCTEKQVVRQNEDLSRTTFIFLQRYRHSRYNS